MLFRSGPTLYAPDRVSSRAWLQLVRLSVATLAPLVMVYLDPHSFACTLWVIAAWELAIALPLRIMLPWVLALSLAMAALLSRGLTTRYALQEIAIFCAFQVYAVITAYVARSEAMLKRRLAAANVELSSTHGLLAHSARSDERLRISRELHDLLSDFLSAGIQIAILVDEYGGTAGVITLNKILSELMGRDMTRWDDNVRHEEIGRAHV